MAVSEDRVVVPGSGEQPIRVERVRIATVVLCLILAVVAVLWAREAELIAFACQITEAVPPMTALGFLILLLVISLVVREVSRRMRSEALAHRLSRLGLSGPQMMYVYAFIMVGTVVFSVGGIRTILPELTTMTYFADPTNDFAAANLEVNPWLHVTDEAAVRQYYEGFDNPPPDPQVGNIPVVSKALSALLRPIGITAAIPWKHWITPLTVWSSLILVVFLTMQCMAGLMEREWTLAERLPYPLVEIPLGITESHSFVKGERFLKDYVMWIGFIIGCGYGLHEMIASTTLAFPLWGRVYPLGKLLTERPWSAASGGVNIFLMPEAYGLAYFASQEVLLSTAVTWLGYMGFTVLTMALGRPLRGPVARDVSLGSFIGFVAAAIWIARKPLGQTFRAAFGGRKPDAEDISDHQLWLARGLTVGVAVIIAFMLWIGLPLHYTLFFVGVFMISAIGHARVRAMAGAATPWLFPYLTMTDGFVRLFGSAAVGSRGDFKPFGAMFHLKWMDRGYTESALAAQAESYNMARRGGLQKNHLSWLMALAIPVALVLGWWMHLTAFYDSGANVLEGGTATGGVRTLYALQDAKWAVGLVNLPTRPDPASWVASVTGLAVTVGSVILRSQFLRFPFHPAGFVIGMNHGERFWAPFLFVWIIKSSLLRFGGVSAYRRLMPGFLGLVIGHFFFTGIVMGLAKMTGLSVFENLPIIWF